MDFEDNESALDTKVEVQVEDGSKATIDTTNGVAAKPEELEQINSLFMNIFANLQKNPDSLNNVDQTQMNPD